MLSSFFSEKTKKRIFSSSTTLDLENFTARIFGHSFKRANEILLKIALFVNKDMQKEALPCGNASFLLLKALTVCEQIFSRNFASRPEGVVTYVEWE